MAKSPAPPVRRYAPAVVVPTEADIVRDYQTAWKAIRGDLERVVAKIEAAKAEGLEINRAWLTQQARLNELGADIERRMAEVNAAAARTLERDRAGLIRRGMEGAASEIEGLGVASRFPTQAYERLAYRRNVQALYMANGARAGQRARRVLLGGLARGRNPRAVARDLQKEVGGSAARALMIARTESMEVYRDAQTLTFRENRDVLGGWEWLAEPDACPICHDLDGEIFPLDQDFYGPHPNCRCTALPVLREGILPGGAKAAAPPSPPPLPPAPEVDPLLEDFTPDQELEMWMDSVWEKGGYETDEVRRVGELIDSHLKKANVAIRAPGEVADLIINDGRFKSQFESRRSRGAFDPEFRDSWEGRQFGYGRDLSPHQRPIYGYLDWGEQGGEVQYGEVQFVLTRDARARTTFTSRDSLGNPVVPSPVNRPNYRSVYPEQYQAMEDGLPFVDHYWEAQVHGGVSMDDVDHIVVWYVDRGEGLKLAARLKAALMKKGRGNVSVVLQRQPEW